MLTSAAASHSGRKILAASAIACAPPPKRAPISAKAASTTRPAAMKTSVRTRSLLRGCGAVAGNLPINECADCCADDRREPEQPQLSQCPISYEYRNTRAARRIHRRVGDRDADQVDQCERKADCNRCEARRCALVGGA